MADPDQRMLRFGWMLWAGGLVVFLIALWAAPAAALPVLMPLGGGLLLWLLWRGGRWLWHVALDAPHADWQGRYYEYDGRQIRVLTDNLDELWFCAADVYDVLGLSGSARDPSRVRLAAGRDGLRLAPSTRMLCFTERGLLAWLERRTEARVAPFRRWLQTQVLSPQQRRRERAGLPDDPGAGGARGA